MHNNHRRIIHVKNEYKLGDNIFNFIMFYHIKDYIDKNNIYIVHYCHEDFISQVSEFKCSNNITILPITKMPNDGTQIYDGWIGYGNYDIPLNELLCKVHNNLLKIVDIPIEISQFVYEDPELLDRYKKINKKTNNKYSNIDVLFANSTPTSGQIPNYNSDNYNDFAYELSYKYNNIVTTEKVEGLPCTRDDNLSVKDIAAISINIKTVIMVDSGVAAALYNTYTLNNADNLVFISTYRTTSLPKFINVKNIDEENTDKLQFLLEDGPIDDTSSDEFYSLIFNCFIVLCVLSTVGFVLYRSKKILSKVSRRV